jgi:DNA-binding transcriptional ArsR family regulator|tara:strand:- start:213 stop:569 length:357 start_codon:yes stop_codon:yes gene_type:complete
MSTDIAPCQEASCCKQEAAAEIRGFLHGELFAALSDPARREIVLLVGVEGELKAGDIAGRFGLDRTTVSRHLGRLSQAGLLEARRLGREIHYRLRVDGVIGQLEGLLTTLKTHCLDCS